MTARIDHDCYPTPPVALRDQMGHVEEGMTERYSRAAVAERVALVDGMARLLGAGGG